MRFLTLVRALCLGYAGFLLLASTMLGLGAAGVPQGEPFSPMWEIMTFVIGVGTLLGSGFLYVGLIGERLWGAVRHRIVAGVLLALPIAVGILVLTAENHPEARPIGWFFLAPAASVLLVTVWPGRVRLHIRRRADVETDQRMRDDLLVALRDERNAPPDFKQDVSDTR